MKSVGEVMSIGSNFQESFQKLYSMEEGLNGLNSLETNLSELSKEEILNELTIPGPKRIFYVADAIRNGWNLDKIHSLTKIDYWFLDQINEIIEIEKDLTNIKENDINEDYLWKIKQKGFSDSRIAELVDSDEDTIRKLRKTNGYFLFREWIRVLQNLRLQHVICTPLMEESVKVIQLLKESISFRQWA